MVLLVPPLRPKVTVPANLPARLASVQFDLSPFVEIDLCAPISTLIKPNTTGGYSLVSVLNSITTAERAAPLAR